MNEVVQIKKGQIIQVGSVFLKLVLVDDEKTRFDVASARRAHFVSRLGEKISSQWILMRRYRLFLSIVLLAGSLVFIVKNHLKTPAPPPLSEFVTEEAVKQLSPMPLMQGRLPKKTIRSSVNSSQDLRTTTEGEDRSDLGESPRQDQAQVNHPSRLFEEAVMTRAIYPTRAEELLEMVIKISPSDSPLRAQAEGLLAQWR